MKQVDFIFFLLYNYYDRKEVTMSNSINNYFSIICNIFYYLSIVFIIIFSLLLIIIPVGISNIKVDSTEMIIFNNKYNIRYFNDNVYLIKGKERIKTNLTRSNINNLSSVYNRYNNKKLIVYFDYVVFNYLLSYLFVLLIFKNIKKLLKDKNITVNNYINKITIYLIIYLVLSIFINFLNNNILKISLNLDFSFYKIIMIYILFLYLWSFNNRKENI